eukprot:5411780-Prorocentrum_lima.AAC.1
MKERDMDIRKLQASHNEMLDELQIPGLRIPSDFEAMGHTQGVVGDVAVTQGPTDRKVIGKVGESSAK